MELVSTNSAAQRRPVGVSPYRVPPLSGLYRMRYYPPTPGGTSSDCLRTESGAEGSRDAVSGARPACSATTGPLAQAGASSVAALHEAVHQQLLRTSSLLDDGIDLFALYSLCEVEPVPCKLCTLHMQTTLNTCSYRLRQSYELQKRGADPSLNCLMRDAETSNEVAASSATESSPLIRILQQGWYVFFFPMSECGRLKDNLLVYVGEALIAGDVAECDLTNARCLRPLKTATTASALPGAVNGPLRGTTTAGASKSTSATSQRWKSLFYYVVSPIPVHWGTRESADVHLTILWRSIPAAYPEHHQRKRNLTILYSYYCSPRAPDTFTCRAHFPSHTRLRLVRSPNCDTKVQLRSNVTERMATVHVETKDGKPLEIHRHRRDYVFVLQFLLGEDSGILEESSVFAAAVVAIVFLLLLWLLLTKDLIL
ncbi:conserved hypothetical protein [Leishmania major strain Friedlin]|uniref:Transmembrane protein n=1 Tax=Leishmania major TaxID=5664 RepID=Q4Q2M9_LEIMA|nr:conserved hypothetical protein [Leishmania major strain Friedlin]CAG9582192.1 hypothetical_protein_-_conserved [Leishmania major strain Friedlin]CAJ08036.1 conserved hypothetical protein [Leishmania major strain Friedlin]|eukprot:XP_001686419.1 conserved hypothetical protein [Leishmania major strain Friedlin]